MKKYVVQCVISRVNCRLSILKLSSLYLTSLPSCLALCLSIMYLFKSLSIVFLSVCISPSILLLYGHFVLIYIYYGAKCVLLLARDLVSYRAETKVLSTDPTVAPTEALV